MSGSHRTFLSYIDKSREYYAAQGYDQPYRWATHDGAPFAPLTKPLADCRVAIVTTTKRNPRSPLGPYAAPAQPQPDSMATDQLTWHKQATTTDDLGSFLPLDHLAALAREGVIGSAAPRFAGITTAYSQRRVNIWAADVQATLEEDDVDLAILIPL